MSWHCCCMLIFFHCLLFRAFAGIACHGLPNSGCTENNGKPVWRARVVEGKRNGWVGVGPTLLPQILWIGFWSRSEKGGGVAVWGRPWQ